MSEIRPEVLKTLRADTALQGINQGTKRTHSFNAEFTEYDESFVLGRFVMHHPSAMERLQIGVTKSQLLGGIVPLDVMTDNLATIISTLDIVIDEKPNWFNVYDSRVDYDILESVYKEYIEWSNSFRPNVDRKSNVGDSTDSPS